MAKIINSSMNVPGYISWSTLSESYNFGCPLRALGIE